METMRRRYGDRIKTAETPGLTLTSAVATALKFPDLCMRGGGPDGGTAGDAGAGCRGRGGAGFAGAVLLEEMLAGWRRQQQARRLTARLTGERERVVRQFAEFTGCWPWQWTAARAEAWVGSGG